MVSGHLTRLNNSRGSNLHLVLVQRFSQWSIELRSYPLDTATPVPEDEVITMDGYPESRLVVAVNGTIPGPAIEAYIGQTVIVYVENHLYASDVTIHWHGLHQKGTPFMDGVPYVTQCPIADNPDVDCRGDLNKNYCNDAAWTNSNWGGDNIPGIKLKRAPLKDTLIIPSGGYAVIRIKADNPGLWFMHCHIEMHSMDGMALILNESFADVPKSPDYLPVCRSFTPAAISRIPNVAETGISLETTTPLMNGKANPKKDREIEIMTFGILIAVICVLSLIIIVLIVVVIKRSAHQNIKAINGATNNGFVK
ncbi:unnamed protein product [Acanthosepion pharaonis]|uniref:Laccase n=1 Tax=Acanthosepion pharaonis TaxID=158019 RepID=A0A812DZR6_ACAPH|nr:unnamed protein product [Sepia pharaonis]